MTTRRQRLQSLYAINNEQDSPYISLQRENETYICSVGTLTRSSRLATNLDPRPSNAQLSHFYNFFPHKILVYLALIYNYNTIIDIFFINPQQHAGMPTRILVNCIAQLLSTSALTWWEAVKIRKTVDVMTSGDFRMEFENKCYIR